VSEGGTTIKPVFIPIFRYPSRHFAIEDEAERLRVRGLTYLCDNSFIHAAIALEGYKQSRREAAGKSGDAEPTEEHVEWPQDYRSELPEFYRRPFVAALFDIEKGIVGYSQVEGLATDPAVKSKWHDAFPGLKDVRDSDQHADERWRGVTKGKPITPSDIEVTLPIDGAFQYAEFNNMTRIWIGDRYSRTSATGHLAEIEVSEEKLATARDIYQEVIDALPWRR
jgi:hypothetical protein